MLSTRRAGRLLRRRVLLAALAVAGSGAWLATGTPTGTGRALHATAMAAEAPIGSFSAPAGPETVTASPFLLKAGVRYDIVVTDDVPVRRSGFQQLRRAVLLPVELGQHVQPAVSNRRGGRGLCAADSRRTAAGS